MSIIALIITLVFIYAISEKIEHDIHAPAKPERKPKTRYEAGIERTRTSRFWRMVYKIVWRISYRYANKWDRDLMRREYRDFFGKDYTE